MPMRFKGSITVFIALLLATLISFSGVLLEIVRWKGMGNIIQEACAGASESVLSYYKPWLWEQYHVYGLSDQHNEEKLMCEYVQNGLNYNGNIFQKKGMDYYQAKVLNVESVQEKRLSDNHGEDFIRQALRYEKIHLPIKMVSDGLNQLLNHAKGVDESKEDSVMNHSKDALKQAEEIKKKQQQDQDNEERAEEKVSKKEQDQAKEEFKNVDNPFTFFDQHKSSVLLNLVLEDAGKSSKQILEEKDCIWNRKLKHGNLEKSADELRLTVLEKFLLGMYTLEHFGYYGQEKKDRGLNYQVESIITKKTKDQEALEGVVLRIMAIREGVNFLYLLTSPSKSQEAFGFATALVGFTGLPPLIEAVKIGILMVWAYTETVSELKALMKGEKIPLIKTDQNFHSCLKNLGKSLEKGNWEDDPGVKISYAECLIVFLMMENQEKMATGMLNCIDFDLQKDGVCTQGIDCFKTKIKGKLRVKVSPVFQVILQDTNNPKLKLQEERNWEIGYVH